MFRPSNDPAALFEYIFHRLLSLHGAEAGDRVHRLHDLAVVLNRERDHLLRDTHTGSLLRCILQCRDVNDAAAGGPTSAQEALVRAELRGILCDLEAEACRQASLFDRCTAIRRLQVAHRLRDFLMDCGVAAPDDTIKRLARDCEDGNLLGAFFRMVGELLSVQRKPPVAVDQLLGRLLRFLDHLIEIAVCRFGLGEVERGKKILKQVRAVCRFALGKEDEDQLLEQLASARPLPPDLDADALLELVRAAQVAFASRTREIVGQIQDIRIRYAFRLMEANLGAISPWESRSRAKLLAEAVGEYTKGLEVLQEYTGWLNRHYDHYVCFLNTHRARAAYLLQPKGEFALAYLFLDAARAAIRRPTRGSDFSAVAVILLTQAECLMLHADAELKTRRPTGAARKAAKVKLDRARTALSQAHSFLERGRPQVWAWTWLRVLEAQLAHELIVWTFDEVVAGREDLAALERRRPDDLDLFREGLTAIRIGLDSCRPRALPRGAKDQRREREFKILWWQLFICFVRRFHGRKDSLDLGDWDQQNRDTGLFDFFLRSARQQSRLEDIRANILSKRERSPRVRVASSRSRRVIPGRLGFKQFTRSKILKIEKELLGRVLSFR